MTGPNMVYSPGFTDKAAEETELKNRLRVLRDYGYTKAAMPANTSGLREVELASLAPLPYKSYYENKAANRYWELEFGEYFFIMKQATIGESAMGFIMSERATPHDARNEKCIQ